MSDNQVDGDKGSDANPSKNQTTSTAAYPNNAPPAGSTPASPTTPSANPNNSDFGFVNAPGRRLKNPLGYLASSTYNISLYMVTADFYNAWVNTGRSDITAFASATSSTAGYNPGVYLVCQSGGINNQSTARAPGIQYDYYIDNLRFSSKITAKEAGGDFFNFDIKFDIIEPYGFRLVSDLAFASQKLYTNDVDSPQNALRNIFVLGIKFNGYDTNGHLVNGTEVFDGIALDPTGTTNGIFQTFYDIKITEFKYTLTGKPITYHIAAASLPISESYGAKRATLASTITINSDTVDGAIKDILNQFNTAEQSYVADGTAESANTYEVLYKADAAQSIGGAKIVSPADVNKYTWSAIPANSSNPSQINPITGITTQPDSNTRTLSFGPGQHIGAMISQIIAQSTYMTNALGKIPKATAQPNTVDGTELYVVNPNPTTIRWYNLSADVKVNKWDKKRGDWTYHIAIIIQPYDTPAVQSPSLGKNLPSYPGPYKIYNYYFGGANTEVLKFDIQYDYTFFLGLVSLDLSSEYVANNPNAVPQAPGHRNNVNQQGSIGPTLEAVNNYRSFLADPNAYNTAKLHILGDPDYLMPANSGAAEVYNKYYGTNGFSINPNSGMCFIEVIINQADDYDTNTGLLKVNHNIQFGPEIKNNIKFKGIPLWILAIDNTFQQGKFTQALHLSQAQWNIDPAGNIIYDDSNQQRSDGSTESKANKTASTPTNTTPATTTNNTAPTTNDDHNPPKAVTPGSHSIPKAERGDEPPFVYQPQGKPRG